MRNRLSAVLFCLALAASAASPDFRTPPLGAAGLATNNIMTWGGYTLCDPRSAKNGYNDHIWIDLSAPTHGLTVCSWVAIHDADGAGNTPGGGGYMPRALNVLPNLYYSPNIDHVAPDLLGGAWGWGGSPVTVSGTISTNYTFPAILDGHNGGTNGLVCFPRGVYTVAWTNLSSTMTLTAGGTDMTLEAPAGNRNVKPGESDGFILAGNGTAQIGISRTKVHPFFSTGRATGETHTDIHNNLVGTNWCFVAHRIRLDSAVHTNALTIVKRDGHTLRTGVSCELPPDGTRALLPSGWYQLLYLSIGTMQCTYIYEWDRRVFDKWLSDDDLSAIFEDGCRIRDAFGYPDCVVTNAIYQEDPGARP